MSSSAKSVSIPKSRLARSAALGGTATRIFGTAAINSVSHWARGERPNFQSLLVTPANMQRLTTQLARMRGAAMKLGQLMSMDAGDMLPPEITEIMARLRADADFMPPKQLKTVLNAEWGDGWLRKFAEFNVRPVAAASIGQVHRALTKDGRDLALKVQYPGVRESIDSDVTNVGSLIRVSGLFPAAFDLDPLLDQAKAQLRDEADYAREARHLQRYSERLKGDDRFIVPSFEPEFSTDRILAMSFVPGLPIERAESFDQAGRDHLMATLLDLTLREVFDWQHMQTDPNFANYRLEDGEGRIILLDFGAAVDIPDWIKTGFRDLLRAAMAGDQMGIRDHSLDLGFWSEDAPERDSAMILDMISYSCAQLTADRVFDFSDTGPAQVMREKAEVMSRDMTHVHVPPVETLLVQRKLAGMYLLARKFGARVNLNQIIQRYLAR